MTNELPDKVKKNLLDLQYNRYLQYYNASVIILFTYCIGVGIAFITKQIDYRSLNQMLLVALMSIPTISVITSLMLQYKWHMINVLDEVRKLKL